MRIAYVINSLEGGGATMPLPDIAQVMRDAGCEVRIFALSRRNGRAAAMLDAAGIRYEVYEGGKADHLRATWWLWRRLHAYAPTLIWTSLTQATIIGQIIGALMRVPVVSWQHNAFLRPANLRLLRLTRRLTRLWVADSEAVAKLSCERLGIARDSLAIWPLFHTGPGVRTAQPCLPGATFKLGSLGRLHPNKGYDVLIEALGRIHRETPNLSRNFTVQIAGEGAEWDRLVALAGALDLPNIMFTGYQPDPQAFLAGLHGYLQPSRAEGLCIAAHEAMLAALPVIVSAVGEMPLTVRNGETGFVVPPEDEMALANAIRSLVQAPAQSFRMGIAGQARVFDRFSQKRFHAAGTAILDIIQRWPLPATAR